MSIWGSEARHKPTTGHLYGLVVKESIYRGLADRKTLPGYGSAYYVENAIERYTGIENAFGKYSITAIVDDFHDSLDQGGDVVGIITGSADPMVSSGSAHLVAPVLTGTGTEQSKLSLFTPLSRRKKRKVASGRCGFRQRSTGRICYLPKGHSGSHRYA